MNVLFVIRTDRPDGRNQCPINCRITVNGVKTSDFMTGIKCKHDIWDSHAQRIKGVSEDAQRDNTTLDGIRTKIKNTFQNFKARGQTLSAQELKDIYLGRTLVVATVAQLGQMHIDYLKTRKNSASTIIKYRRHYKYLIEFVGDIDVRRITVDKMNDFHGFLNKSLSHDYSNKICQTVKSLFIFGQKKGLLDVNPLRELDLTWITELDITSLEPSEIQTLEQFNWNETLQKVVDGFLFMCFTGLHVADYKSLKSEHIKTVQGREFIFKKREKTKIIAKIPLHQKAKNIVEKYGGIEHLPHISDQKMNVWLKVIASLAGIDKKLTTKIARKTFTNFCINENRMSFETVATMLGHTSTRQIKHYGAVNEKRILAEWKEFI